ncbi:Transposon Tf2-6 polyprotein [Labeo rohita]|uniref:Gypsy retrotransposon integrase-like protein 1 n=1 Tax=Labeo rohita TaxID=84645 RepID=A0ABQ8MBT0_LABRO|nr:Transposon Tf2-6 polyprotein [Labeo rohita]
MEEYMQEALTQGYIRPSTSPATSSFFFVSKKDGGLRPCIDYRALNQVTVKFSYPLPLIPNSLEQLRGAQIYSKLDLHSAYNLVRIHRGDEWKTAFITPRGHYEYLVMAYGLANAPSVFQNFMNTIFQEYINRFVIVYIDDILIYSPSLTEHIGHVKLVLQKLREFSLFLKAEKCEFHVTCTSFLGYIISPTGVSMDERKVVAISSWPTPTTVKELQRFLGFSNFYRRFIKNYSQVVSPLTSLLKNKPKKLTWPETAAQAFHHLKQLFIQAPILIHPNPDLPFTVEVDASSTGVGAVLSQQPENSPVLHPCAFFSRKFNLAEANYNIGNWELLAVKLALEEWREKNVPADALSRLHAPPEEEETPDAILPGYVFVSPIQWAPEEAVADMPAEVPPGCPPDWQYVTPAQRTQIISQVHSSLGTGHPGSNRTLSLVSNTYWWPNMALDVRRFVRGCADCAMAKTPRHLPTGKLFPLPVPCRPWSHLGVDFATDLPNSRGDTCIFIIVDGFSKLVCFIPLKGLPTAMETAELLFNHVFCYFGIPEDIVSDRGPQFISRVWRAFFKLLGVTVSLSSSYHPQSNGLTERKIQDLSRFLRTFCHKHQDTWNQFLPWAEYAQNSLKQQATGLTPFQCVLGYQPPMLPWSEEPSDVPSLDFWFQESERVWDSAHHHLQEAIRRFTQHADTRCTSTPRCTSGQKVWLSTRNIHLRLSCKKLTLKPYHPPVLSPSSTEPGEEETPPDVIKEGIYRVREILDSRWRGGALQYLVDWEDFGPEERSWVPRDDILDPDLLREFHAAHPSKPAPRSRGRPPRRKKTTRPSGADRGGGGVLSRNHLAPPLTRPRSHLFVPRHRITNHIHLFIITATTYKAHTHLHSSSGLVYDHTWISPSGLSTL